MSLTKEQIIKIEDWKAQHNIILGKIKVANLQLEELLKKETNVEIDISKNLYYFQQKQEELKDEEKKEKVIIYNLKSQSEELRNEISDLLNDIRVNSKSLRTIRSEENESITELSKVNKSILSSSSKLDKLNTSIITSNDKLLSVNDNIKQSKLTEKLLNKTISEMIQKRYKTEMTFKKEYSSQKLKLNSIKDKIKIEKSKIESPILYLRSEEMKLKKKERNLNTLIRRFKKYYTDTFPDRELKI